MKLNFFIHELRRVQERFNQTFGRRDVCDLETRYQVILSIISMELISKQIIKTENKDKVREEIQLFVKTNQVLNEIFRQAEKCWEERGHYEKINQANR
jgi:hypothetical protein